MRVLLVNNPLSSFFMAARLSELSQQRAAPLQTIVLYCPQERRVEDHYSENIDEKMKLHRRACLAPLEGSVDQVIEKHPRRYLLPNVPFNRNILRERFLRKNELHELSAFLKSWSIDVDQVDELWYSSSSYDFYFLRLCKNAQSYLFDHGLAEIIYSVENKMEKLGPFRRLKRKVKKWIHRNVVYFGSETADRSQYLSLLADEIRSIHPSFSLTQAIQTKELKRVGERVLQGDPSVSFFEELGNNGKSALILPLFIYSKPWPPGAELHQKKMLMAFEKEVLLKLAPKMMELGIKNLVIKGKPFHDEMIEETMKEWKEIHSLFGLHYLPSISKNNYPAEYYFQIWNPSLIVGAYSSAMLYSKKITPSVLTAAFDQWIYNYCASHGFEKFEDIPRTRDFFESKYDRFFKNVIPDIHI